MFKNLITKLPHFTVTISVEDVYFCRMSTQTISRKDLRQFSAFSAAFGEDQTPFSSFIQTPFQSIDTLKQQALLKQGRYAPESRAHLVATLRQQTGSFLSGSQAANLDLLAQETTFTITTGHQLTLFGGPMFLLYKVLHVVKLSADFNASQPDFKAVPVFWMASEDHDVDEIRSARLFGKTLTWETEQKGPVGRFGLDDYSEVSETFKEFFASREGCELLQLLDGLTTTNYGEYYQQFISKLFAAFGVLVLLPDTPELKKLFVPVIQKELTEQRAFPAVEEANKRMIAAGLKPQALARSCNLFLLDELGRHRIDPSANGFTVDGTVYTTAEMLALTEEHPEQFSPNVILRPVYQETILPNLAYIGGGGEMAYWIQLKGVFDTYDVPYPLIQQRNSLMIVDGGTTKRMEKLNWELPRFFGQKEQLRKEFLNEHDEGQESTQLFKDDFQRLRLSMIAKAKEIDISLESFAEAETVRMSKQLESFEQRLLKQVKQQHEQSLKAIDAVSDRLFPENELQERSFHWLNFAPNGDYSPLLEQIYEAIDPFEGDLIVVELN